MLPRPWAVVQGQPFRGRKAVPVAGSSCRSLLYALYIFAACNINRSVVILLWVPSLHCIPDPDAKLLTLLYHFLRILGTLCILGLNAGPTYLRVNSLQVLGMHCISEMNAKPTYSLCLFLQIPAMHCMQQIPHVYLNLNL